MSSNLSIVRRYPCCFLAFRHTNIYAAFDIFATQPERVRLVPEAVLRVNGHVWPDGSSELLKGKPAPGPAQGAGEGCA